MAGGRVFAGLLREGFSRGLFLGVPADRRPPTQRGTFDGRWGNEVCSPFGRVVSPAEKLAASGICIKGMRVWLKRAFWGDNVIGIRKRFGLLESPIGNCESRRAVGKRGEVG